MNKKSKTLLTAILLIVCVLTLSVGLTGCLNVHVHKYTYVSDGAQGHHRTCTECEKVNDTIEPHEYGDDDVCDKCGYVFPGVPVTNVTMSSKSENVYVGGTLTLTATVAPEDATNKALSWQSSAPKIATVSEGVVKGVAAGEAVITVITADGNKTDTCAITVIAGHDHVYDEDHWAYDATYHYHACTAESGCTARKDEAAHTIGNDMKCSVCGAQFKEALFEFTPTALEAKTYADDFGVGIFKIIGGTTIRNRARENYDVYDLDGNVVASGFTATKSVQYNGTNRGFGIYAPAAGKLTLYLDNGSSGLAEGDFQTLLLTKPDGTTETISYPAKKLRRYEIDCTSAGYYTITRGSGSTTDVYYAKFETVVPVTPVEKIEVANPGTTEFLVGQDFDSSKLQLQLVYTMTGMVEPVALDDTNLTIDSSAYDKEHAGKYTIGVTYTTADGAFNTSYDVSVYGVESIKLGYNAIIQGHDGYNGTYENVPVRQFYFTNGTITLDGLTVYTVFKGGAQETKVTEGYTTNAASIDMTTAGEKEIVVTWTESPTITASFKIYVAEKPTVTGDTVTAKVDPATAVADIGTLKGGAYAFRTIQQALEFMVALDLDDTVAKVIDLAAGTYHEKVEVRIPNLTIKGASADTTVIEWDALYGDVDESGFTHTTDSTATLNVRRAATGFTIENVTISNAWNSTAYFDEKKGANYNEHRALAALFQTDRVVVDNCRLLGYQDTVEFFSGRQYVLNSYIQGRTDFIFGTNNTTYFYNCEIHSIVRSGYVTAFKGSNKGAEDSVTYGAVFDHCRFTAEADVLAAKDTALGRPWGAYAAVAVINSELGEHISTAASSGKSSGERYVTMSNNNPYDANVKFVEYNNTGAGAIAEAVKGMRMLDATEAAAYMAIATVFGKTNGNVTYTSEWDGSKGIAAGEKVLHFADYYASGDAYNNYHDADNEAFFGSYATITGKWAHELNQNKNHAKLGDGTVITFLVKGEVTVKTYGSAYGLPENVRTFYKNGYATLTIVKTASSPIANGCYITEITIDMSKTPEDSEVNYNFAQGGGDVIGTNSAPASMFNGDITVVGKLRDNTNSYQSNDGVILTFTKQGQVTINWYPGYGNDSNAAIFYSGGKAEVTITGTPYIISITLDTSVIPADSTVVFNEDKVIGMSALPTTYEGTCGRYEGIEIDATNGKLAPNGDWAQMNNGTVLKVAVAEDIAVSVTEYQNAGLVEISARDANGIVTLTATGNTYISQVIFTIERLYDHDEVIDLKGLSTAYEGNTGSYLGIKIDATNGKFANNNSGWIQMNANTVIRIHVAEGIAVSVTEYQDAGKVTIGERDADGWVAITATASTYISQVKVTLAFVTITENFVYTYAQGGRTDGTLEIGTSQIKFENCKVNNSWLKYGTITLKVKAGAKIIIKGSQWDGTVTVNGNTVEHTVDGNYWMYTYEATEDGTITIYSSQSYLASISVVYDE